MSTPPRGDAGQLPAAVWPVVVLFVAGAAWLWLMLPRPYSYDEYQLPRRDTYDDWPTVVRIVDGTTTVIQPEDLP